MCMVVVATIRVALDFIRGCLSKGWMVDMRTEFSRWALCIVWLYDLEMAGF